MIRYALTTPAGEVQVSLDSEQPNKVAPLQYRGPSAAVLGVKRWLYFETGSYGQQLGDWTAPRDLELAMSKPRAVELAPKLLEKEMGLKRVASAPGEG